MATEEPRHKRNPEAPVLASKVAVFVAPPEHRKHVFNDQPRQCYPGAGAQPRARAGVASQSFIGMGIVPVGALLGGILGEQLGVPATIVIGAFGGVPSFLWVVFSPVRSLRVLPTARDEELEA